METLQIMYLRERKSLPNLKSNLCMPQLARACTNIGDASKFPERNQTGLENRSHVIWEIAQTTVVIAAVVERVLSS